MDYKISIITPVYNAEKTLPNTFASILAQTIGFENIEYILVDDCSTDSSRLLCNHYAEQYPNVVVLCTISNTGSAGAPRNIGLDHARAPYIMFVDNDDALAADGCEILYKNIHGTDLDIVSGICKEANPGRHKEGNVMYNIYDPSIFKEGVYDISVLDTNIHAAFYYNFWTKIYKKEIIDRYQIRFVESLMWEDLGYLFLYLSVCRSGKIIHRTIYLYNTRDESLSHRLNEWHLSTVPKGIYFYIQKAEAIQHFSSFIALLNHADIFENYVDLLLGGTKLDNETIARVVLCWRDLLAYVYESKISLHSTYAKILSRDMAECDDERVLYDYFTLRDLYQQRKRQLEDIYHSRIWKTVNRFHKAAGWLKNKKANKV